jgi:hypothetical protein
MHSTCHVDSVRSTVSLIVESIGCLVRHSTEDVSRPRGLARQLATK